jgi:hypothetical protein
VVGHRDHAQALPAGAEAQRGARRGPIRPGPDGPDAGGVQVLQRVEQRPRPEVQRMVVRERDRVDPELRQAPRGERRRTEEEGLARLREGGPALGDAALEVEQEEVRLGGRRHDLRREQRRRGITPQPLGDAAAEHRVSGQRQRQHAQAVAPRRCLPLRVLGDLAEVPASGRLAAEHEDVVELALVRRLERLDLHAVQSGSSR